MSPAPLDPAGREAYDLERDYVFASWSAQADRDPLAIAGGQGCRLIDYDGRSYLDFTSQLMFANLGYQHPAVVAAITEQATQLATLGPNSTTAARGTAAKMILDLLPPGYSKVFFTNGGADANENAIRLARVHTGRHKVLSAYRSYHGNTAAAIAATGDPRRWPNEFAAGHVHFFGPFPYRSPFWSADPDQETQRALAHLEQVIIFEGPQTIAAILLESIVGSAGLIPPPPGYLVGVRDLCSKYGIVFIADEVMVGFGRTGEWFGFQHYLDANQSPDLITFAKGVNSGYVPIGGVAISSDIAATFDDRVFPGGLTYSGHPLACASVIANLQALQDEQVVQNVRTVGDGVLGPGLRELATRHEVIGDVRGLGLFWGLDLVTDRVTKEPIAAYGQSSPAVGKLIATARQAGLVIFMMGNRVQIAPPLIITEQEVRDGLEMLDTSLTATFG